MRVLIAKFSGAQYCLHLILGLVIKVVNEAALLEKLLVLYAVKLELA